MHVLHDLVGIETRVWLLLRSRVFTIVFYQFFRDSATWNFLTTEAQPSS